MTKKTIMTTMERRILLTIELRKLYDDLRWADPDDKPAIRAEISRVRSELQSLS